MLHFFGRLLQVELLVVEKAIRALEFHTLTLLVKKMFNDQLTAFDKACVLEVELELDMEHLVTQLLVYATEPDHLRQMVLDLLNHVFLLQTQVLGDTHWGEIFCSMITLRAYLIARTLCLFAIVFIRA